MKKFLGILTLCVILTCSCGVLSACGQENSTNSAKLDEYDARIEALETVSGQNKKAIADLTAEYNAKIEALEMANSQNNKVIADLIVECKAKIDAVETADNENKKAIADLTAEYNAKIEVLETADGENKRAIAELTAEYNAKIEALETADSENEQAIADLTAEYNAKIEALKTADNKNEQAIADLTAEYNAKIEALEKAIIDNENSISETMFYFFDKIHTVEIENNNNTQKINKLTTEYNAKLQALENAVSEYEQAIADLTNEHNARIETLESTVSEYEQAIADLTSDYNAKISSIIGVLEDLNINVVTWEVTFDSNGGTEVESQTVANCSKIIRPVEPVRENYVFDGWYVDDEKWAFSGYIVTGDITLTAKWKYAFEFELLQEKQILTKYIGSEVEVVIPSEYEGYPVTAIDENAFFQCDKITSVEIPNSVTSIGSSAFYNCSSLKSVTIGMNVTKIGSHAFAGCSSLIIKCKASSKPSGWSEQWNSSNCLVVWNKDEITFIMPVENGVCITEYTDNSTIYNPTLGIYTAHFGVDIGVKEGEEGGKVYCCYDGVIEKINKGYIEGTTVTINHGNGLKTIYNSIDLLPEIVEGMTVLQGDELGVISTNNRNEYKSGPHLHFEVKENGNSVSPNKYYKFYEE